MITLKLKDIEDKIKSNSSTRKDIINNFEAKTMQSDRQKGRVRPKHPIEAKILSRFTKK